MSTGTNILGMEMESKIRDAVAAAAGEEYWIERTPDGHIGNMHVEIDGRKIMARIVVVGDWDDWWLDSVCYS